MLTFASPQAAEYGKPEDTERRVGGRSGVTRDGNRKTHRGLQGKQEGLLGHYFSPSAPHGGLVQIAHFCRDRKSTRLNSSHPSISYAVFCLKKKTNKRKTHIE